MPELLCLKWNNHSSAFDKLLRNIHLKNIYADGTLICHGKFYPVHRFVLSTCSEYFDEIFKQCLLLECKHPVIIVKDIMPLQIEALLNYMYRGEVNVPQEMLPDLIKAAEAFKIKGLAVPDDDVPTSKSLFKDRKRSCSSPSNLQIKRSRKFNDRHFKNACRKESGIVGSFTDLYDLESNGNISKDDDIISGNKQSSDSNAEGILEMYKNSKSSDEFQSDALISETVIKCEPIDNSDIAEITAPKHTNSLENLTSEAQTLKSEDQSYDSYTSSDHFPSFEEESERDSHLQFDQMQKISPWKNKNREFQVLSPSTETTSEDLSRSTLEQRSFQTQFNYNSYRDIRSDQTLDKPFKCSSCPYRCYTSRDIKRHTMHKHTKEKPLRCPSCDYGAIQSHQLKLHIKNKHP